MANLKSSKKDIRRSNEAKQRNTSAKSALKTHIKRVRQVSVASDATSESVKSVVTTAVKALDKAAQKGIIPRNQAARRKSRMAKAANKALAAS